MNKKQILAIRDNNGNRLDLRVSSSGWVVMWKESDVFSFDLNGRPRSILLNGDFFRRGTDHRTFQFYPGKESSGHKRVRELCDKEKRALYEEVIHRCEKYYSIMETRAQKMTGADALFLKKGRKFFSLVKDGMPGTWEGDHRRFHRLYKSISILPPDQYRALVIQISEGCPWNRCTFCDLYRDRDFRPRSPGEVRKHVQQLQDFFGDGIHYYRSIFLGDANALAMNDEPLLEIMRDIQERFLSEKSRYQGVFSGIYSFVDIQVGIKKKLATWKRLRELGLRRLYIGLESGSERVRKFLNKPGTNRSIMNLMQVLRKAKIEMGVILLIGVGGKEYEETHISESVSLLNGIPLGPGDFIYFSHFVEHPGSAYQQEARREKIVSLSSDEMIQQEKRIREELKVPPQPRGPYMASYTLERFVY